MPSGFKYLGLMDFGREKTNKRGSKDKRNNNKKLKSQNVTFLFKFGWF